MHASWRRTAAHGATRTFRQRLESGCKLAVERRSQKRHKRSLAADRQARGLNLRGAILAVSAGLALRLARYLGTSAEFWLGLQLEYDLRVATQAKLKEIERAVRSRSEAA